MKTTEEKITWRTQRAIELNVKLDKAKATKQNTGILECAIDLNKKELDKLINPDVLTTTK